MEDMILGIMNYSVSLILEYRSLEVAILEVASFGGYGLGVFNTLPTLLAYRRRNASGQCHVYSNAKSETRFERE